MTEVAAMQLPWTMRSVPHAVLDILRGCNIRCRDCCNLRPDRVVPLDEIEHQLDDLMQARQLHSVSIVGGEITLHPGLVEIVRRVRGRKLFVELFTNGVELTDELLAQLKAAGANVIFLHIEPGQRRPDLPTAPTIDEVQKLRERKVKQVADYGIEVGLAMTAYPDKTDELEETIQFALQSPNLNYLLVTMWRDVARMQRVRGDLEKGMFSDTGGKMPKKTKNDVSHREITRLLQRRFGLTPFAYVGSNADENEPRWLSFLVATLHLPDKVIDQHTLKATWLEGIYLEGFRRLAGRYPFYQRQSAALFGLQVLINGMAGRGFMDAVKFLAKSCRRGTRLSSKRLLFQWPAEIDAQGRVICCRCCPDAVVKDGNLVPLCISDLVVTSRINEATRRRILLRNPIL